MEVTLALLGIIFTYIIIFFVRWGIKRHKSHQILKRYGIPGPEPDFFAGNMYHYLKDPTPNDIFTSWSKKYGDVCGYYVSDTPFVIIKNLEMLKKIMIKDFNLFTNRPDLFINSGVLTSTLIVLKDKRWKQVRNIITPMFSSGKIKQMTNVVSKKVDITVDLIQKKANDGEIFDIYSMVQGLTLDVIGACALAMKTKCQENQNDELLLAVRDFLRFQHNKGIEYSVMFPFVAKILAFLSKFTALGRATDYITDHLERVVKYRHNNPDVKSVDILQSLLDNCESSETAESESNKNLTEAEVISNAFLVFLAGYETTATSLAYTFYLLVKHPDVQERLYEEINEAEDDSYATIQSLQYLDQVFSEALRMYPPVTGFISRTCDEDYQIESFTLPKGCVVMAPVWDIHHDPDLWPDPWKFNPDRFSPSNKGAIKNMSYMPFGVGPRNCVGARFAQLEAKMILFKLLKQVKLEACERTEEKLDLLCHTVITFPKNGVWVRAVPRSSS